MSENTLAPAPHVPLEDVLWKVDSRGYESSKSSTGWVARFVPYLNASTVARLLDEWVGPDAWYDEYENVELGGHKLVACRLTINGVTKFDVGVPPSGGAEMGGKGAVSDAFKRAASLKWGVGRNVYTLPNLYGPVNVRNPNQPEKCKAVADIDSFLVGQLRDRGFDVERVAAADTAEEAA